MKLPIWPSQINSSLDICESPTWDSGQIFTNHIMWAFSLTSRPDLSDLFCSMYIMLAFHLPLGVNFSLSKEWCLYGSSFIFGATEWFAGRPGCLFTSSIKSWKEICCISICLLCMVYGNWKERIDLHGGSLRGQSLWPQNPSLNKDYGMEGWSRKVKSLSSRNSGRGDQNSMEERI